MIPVPEVTPMVKRTVASAFEKCLLNSAAKPSLLGDSLFVSELIDFIISSKEIPPHKD